MKTGTLQTAPLTICGINELGLHCRAGVTHLLSILDPGWPVPETLTGYGALSRLELRFHDVLADEPGIFSPQREHVEQLLAFGRTLSEDSHLLVHCHAGVSRSTAAMALILAQQAPDEPAAAAFSRVRQLRPQAWPNLRMLELGDELLDRRGEIVEAAAAVYRDALARDPFLSDTMTMHGRGREVECAARLSIAKRVSDRNRP